MSEKFKMNRKSFFKNLLFGVKIFGIAILLAIFLRFFVFSSFKIPTPSMEPAILPGDYILVNKLAYGARIPKNLQFRQGGAFETFRVKGFSKVKRNDVIVFNFPYPDWSKLGWDLNVYYVKRCVALPGDTFYIDRGIYKVKNCTDTLGCYSNQLSNQRRLSKNKENVEQCFPFDEAYNWTVRDFGPLYIPRKGDRLAIDSQNILLYRNLIAYETGRELRVKQDTVYWGDAVLRDYVFQQNYYFMTGDYVFDSLDSRYWGLLPEDHIVGKASVIWQSKDMNTGKRKWERVLKTIN